MSLGHGQGDVMNKNFNLSIKIDCFELCIVNMFAKLRDTNKTKFLLTLSTSLQLPFLYVIYYLFNFC